MTPEAPAAPEPTEFLSHIQLILARLHEQPDRVVLADGRRAVTGIQLDCLVRALADRLAADGVGTGSTVALAAPNIVEAVAARYAAGLLGAVTTVSPHIDEPARLAEYVRAVAADVLVCFPSTEAAAQRVLAQGAVARIALTPLATERMLDRRPAAARSGSVPPGQRAVLISSGGTTGGAKASYRSYAQWLAMVDTGPAPDRRQLICCSLAYIPQVHLDQTLLGGGAVVLVDRFDPETVLRTVEAERITHLCLVEPLLVELADHPDVDRRDLSSLTTLAHIGADAAPSLRRRLLGRLGPRLAHPYGASEAGIVSMLTSADYSAADAERLDTCGAPLPGVQVRIERRDGTVAVAGAQGAIVVRSNAVAGGYVGAADASAFRADGWYATGDLGYLDGSGALHVRGRARDLRLRNGAAVLPLDLQDALCAQPGVRFAVAIPAEDEADGFDAVVVLEPGSRLTISELRDRVRDRHGDACAPAAMAAVRRVPVTEQGKPDRGAIRALLDARAADVRRARSGVAADAGTRA